MNYLRNNNFITRSSFSSRGNHAVQFKLYPLFLQYALEHLASKHISLDKLNTLNN